MNKKNNKGFTLAELLIVVAIIAVLVAIAIPVFSAQLERSREATDIANIRSAYAEVVAKGLEDSANAHSTDVKLKQQQAGWQTANNGSLDVAGVKWNAISVEKDGSVNVKYHPASGSNEAYVTIGGSQDANKTTTGYTVS